MPDTATWASRPLVGMAVRAATSTQPESKSRRNGRNQLSLVQHVLPESPLCAACKVVSFEWVRGAGRRALAWESFGSGF